MEAPCADGAASHCEEFVAEAAAVAPAHRVVAEARSFGAAAADELSEAADVAETQSQVAEFEIQCFLKARHGWYVVAWVGYSESVLCAQGVHVRSLAAGLGESLSRIVYRGPPQPSWLRAATRGSRWGSSAGPRWEDRSDGLRVIILRAHKHTLQ